MRGFDTTQAVLREVLDAIFAEDELDGHMPDDLWAMYSTREGAEDVLRAAVRVTKSNILSKVAKIAAHYTSKDKAS